MISHQKNHNTNHIIDCNFMQKSEQLAFQSNGGSFTFMRLAGEYVAKFCHQHYTDKNIAILCGQGNNGGDGYVAAKWLQQNNHHVDIYQHAPPHHDKTDAYRAYQESLEANITIYPLDNALQLTKDTIIIDALFGIGLNRDLPDNIAHLANILKDHHIVAIDIASGVNADNGHIMKNAFRANHTISFWQAKYGHILLPGAAYRGQLHLCDLPINSNCDQYPILINDNNHPQIPIPTAFDHKYKRGMAAIIAGGTKQVSAIGTAMPGASRLAARACQRAGAGYVSIFCPWDSFSLYQGLDSIVVKKFKDKYSLLELCDDKHLTAITIGPGQGLHVSLRDNVISLLEHQKPIVIDGDGLSVFEHKPELLKSHNNADKTILTPHDGEFARIFPNIYHDPCYNKFDKTIIAAKQTQATIIYKGFDTIIASADGRVAALQDNTPWLATAGSGDVLSGICCGFLAQGMDSFNAAVLACYCHVKSATCFGVSLIAEDIINALPKTINQIMQKSVNCGY